ncbi:helix-turn-helix transcriptional regulator [Thermomonospora umbrina]|uniref:Putative DNA-binding transcriptional regulator YafY n=1 Tax=Thermomonospora umbrina TaxID=111806 RepID=A0A3D9SUY2_9ACTN|nr:YafY family protein [Thermomonospora umbrina]REE98300.1 putative DNA-binding transcriptional regulator YafY [Thermomonospora umbrina]
MANTSARMLRLLSLLQTHRYWAGGELADRLGVSERTLRRDIDRLRDLGYPVDAGRGVGGGYQLRSGAAMPPLLLDDEEAVAIAIGLGTAAAGAVGGMEETAVRALAKVVQVMPPRLRRRVEALHDYSVPAERGGAPPLDAVALTVIARCCRDDERLRFGYRARDGRETRRTVEPHRLVSRERLWYLVAWDMERHDWRTFRVDRLADPEPTGERFRQRELPGGDVAAFVRRQITSIPKRYQVVVDIARPADEIQRRVGTWGEVEATGAGDCRLTMHVDALDWTVMVLATVDAGFEVIRPAELRDRLRSVADHFDRAAGAP